MSGKAITRPSGFTLLELVITIVILSISSLAVMAPLFISSKGIGAGGPAREVQMVSLAEEYAETISSDLTGISKADWSAALSRLVASSPIAIRPDISLNGKSFQVNEAFTCVAKEIETIDSSCTAGFVKISVSVTIIESGKTFNLIFIKTRAGI